MLFTDFHVSLSDRKWLQLSHNSSFYSFYKYMNNVQVYCSLIPDLQLVVRFNALVSVHSIDSTMLLKKIPLLSELIDMGLFLRHGHFISSFGFHYIVSTLSVCQDLIPFTGLKRKVKKG